MGAAGSFCSPARNRMFGTGTIPRLVEVEQWSIPSFLVREIPQMRTDRLGLLGLASPFFLSACALFQPPIRPSEDLLGCYRLETDLPASYEDSLGYEIPGLVRLTLTEYDQAIVLPTDREWHPSWTIVDDLPSGYVRRVSALRSAPASQIDSIRTIPGDSIDISFPSAIGRLVFRVGPDGGRMQGRAEWVIDRHISFLNEGYSAIATPSPCEGLPMALTRTRYRESISPENYRRTSVVRGGRSL